MDTPASTLEWEEHTTRSPKRIRCIPQRVGSVLRGDTHRRLVVLKGKMLPHTCTCKLPRVASSDASSKNLPKESGKQNVLLMLDNTTAVAYVNNLGGSVSALAMKLARELHVWMWCLECQIHLTAQHLPGKDNVSRADTVSRQMKDRSDWMFNPSISQSIMGTFPYLEVDLHVHCICNMPDLPTRSFLQLETRPTGRSDGLESNTGLCQPPHGT